MRIQTGLRSISRARAVGFGLLVLGHSLLICALLPAWGASAVTLEQIRSYTFPESLVASPKGSQIAWIVDDHGRRNVWVATGPQFKAQPLTNYAEDDGQEITSLQFSADGTQIVYVRGGEHGGNWDHELPTNVLSQPAATKVEIWSVAFSGGPPHLLAEGDSPSVSADNHRVAFLKDGAAWVAPIDGSSEAKRLFTIRGNIHSLKWSPDGSRLAFVASREAHALIGIYADEHTPILWLAPSTSRDGSPRWSPDGKRVVFVRLPGDGGVPEPALQFQPQPWAIWVADATTGLAQLRWTSGKLLRDSYDDAYLEWVAGGRIVFRSYMDGWQHLYSMPESGGEPVLLTSGDYMVEDIALSADKQYLIFSANAGSDPDDMDRRHLFKVPANGGKIRQLTSGAGLEWSPVITGDNHLVFLSATTQRPPMLAMLPKEDGQLRLLATDLLAPSYPEKQLVTPKRVTFQAKDGVTVHGQLFEPVGGRGNHAAVLYIHGGPQRQMLLGWHYMGYYSNDYAVNQYLASRGYVVLAVNYRLGIGYGHDFQYPPSAGSRGAAEYQDIQAAGRYLQSLPIVDAKRIGLYGGSYGGYLTAMGLAHDSGLFAVGVDIHGVHNWTVDYGADELLAGKRHEMPADAERALDVAWQSSPVAATSSWKSPVLFIHGDDDRNVRFRQTVDLVRRLDNTGARQETLVLVDETHSIQRYENVLRMNQATMDFLVRYLGH